MMKVDGKISISQAIMIIMLTVGITNHVTVIPLLLSKAGRDSWISVLLTVIPFFLWASLLTAISRRANGLPLHEWVRQEAGPIASWLLKLPILLVLYAMAQINLIDTQSWTTINYLPNTPEWVTALVLVLICVIAACGGINSLGVTSGVLLPVVSLLGFFVAFGNVPKKEYSFLFPILQNGVAPALNGMMYAGSGSAEMFLMLLIQHHVRKPLRLVHYLVMAVIIVILTLSPLTGAIAEFGPTEATRQRFPSFEQWRLLTIGKDLENVEFLAIFQWLSGAFVRISLCLLLILELLHVKRAETRWLTLFFLGTGLIVLTVLPFSDMQFITFLARFYYPYHLVIVLAVTALLTGIYLFRRTRQEDAGHDT